MEKIILMRILSLLGVAGVLVAVAGCGGTSAGGGSDSLSLVAYSTPQEAYEGVIPAFQKTEGGAGVTFKQSYGASGDQARAVLAGLPADVVALSLEPDVNKLVDAGKVPENWAAGPQKGIVTDSVVVLATRPGNPKNIKTWDDVVKPGVEIVTPNPQTSGGAKWNLMAAYGAQIKQGKTPAQADDFVAKLFKNTVSADKSAREALQTFDAGKGDVLLAYENEALTAKSKGLKLDYVIPDQTILIENPIAVTTAGEKKPAAEAFVEYARTPAAQKIYGEKGYRSVLPNLVDKQKYPTPPGLFTITDLGGWKDVNKKYFDEKDGIITKIQEKSL
jgi:sulfate/thiosulfate-binding protein